jgi:hypothetical protein
MTGAWGMNPQNCWGYDRQYRARISMGTWLLRKNFTARLHDDLLNGEGGLLLAAGGTDHQRKLEKTIQHQTTTQSPTGTGSHNTDGTQTNHAVKFKLDHLSGADHQRPTFFVLSLLKETYWFVLAVLAVMSLALENLGIILAVPRQSVVYTAANVRFPEVPMFISHPQRTSASRRFC